MTLIKSLLLGSAAGIVAVASAQAADLPTKKGAPAAQYVKICTITANGTPITGFVLPGSDTCLKISGYVTAQIEAGNLKQGAPSAANPTGGTFRRDSFGYTTRENLTLDAVSNTAMGPLLSHMEFQAENGNGFDNTGTSTYINKAYVQWAGITAGKAASFFSFTGGGPGWANFFSPDRQGFNQPELLAYTATFGGGFSATLSFESAGGVGASGPGTNMGSLGTAVQGGMRAPDVVGALRVDQGWGSAQISGVLHNVRADAVVSTLDTWGYALDAGVKFNLPSIGGDLLLTGAYSKNAVWYSGIPDGMWGENGAVNGNGIPMAIGDTAFQGLAGGWATPTAWSIAATADFKLSPQVSISPEAAYAQINWSGVSPVNPVGLYNSKSWIVGAVGHYDPVPGLDFELELLYQNTNNSRTINTNFATGPNPNGFAGRFEITRSF